MGNNESILQQLKQQQLLPLFYHSDQAVCIGVARALYAAGIRMMEFTNRGEAALDNCKALVAAKQTSMPDLLLAVGTIGSAKQAEQFIAAGADCLISPFFDAGVCDVAYSQKVCWIPGCITPTEVHTAVTAGCSLVKVFPGNVVGPALVSSIKELFPGVEWMPTGGVRATADNLGAWFEAGVCAVGMGSQLISQKAMAEKDYATIEADTKRVLTLIQSIKK
jgi:2-dehydro-3-deoxyphosphogluconate aldolase / (4S)-4-hydroxy-2-oxoglutarate aldolase